MHKFSHAASATAVAAVPLIGPALTTSAAEAPASPAAPPDRNQT
ncbi:hypothetical protein [Streptomyces sp. NPDC048516]